MRILLTAYGPFGGVKENITERVADKILTTWDTGENELTALKLSVEWNDAMTRLNRALERINPDVLVSMGHAEGYSAVTIETRYFNIAEGADNKGKMREGGVIRRGGEDFYDANIDTKNLARYLAQRNIPVNFHAGKEGMTYLCNFAGYVVMQHLHARRKKLPLFVFLHLPPDQLPFLRLVRAVVATAEALLMQARP